MLEKRTNEIENEAKQIQEKMERTIASKSRYVPVPVRRLIDQKFGQKCSRQNCDKKADHLHHSQHYSAGGLQTPENLRPLCRGHHELQHAE